MLFRSRCLGLRVPLPKALSAFLAITFIAIACSQFGINQDSQGGNMKYSDFADIWRNRASYSPLGSRSAPTEGSAEPAAASIGADSSKQARKPTLSPSMEAACGRGLPPRRGRHVRACRIMKKHRPESAKRFFRKRHADKARTAAR